MKRLFVILVFSIVSFSSCSVAKFARYYASADTSPGKLTGRVYESKDTSYEIGKLSDNWRRINIEGGDIAFWNGDLRATITVNSTCRKKTNYSLKALSQSLLIGITDKQMVETRELTINGEKALESIYLGKLDNVSIKLGAVVLKKDNCVYDFTYTSSPDDFDGGFDDFREFVSQFKVIKK
jgi:hypothetical protein